MKVTKKQFKIFTILIILFAMTALVFADSTNTKLQKWLDKYETFVESVEDAAKNNQTSKIKELKAKQENLIAEKEKLQKAGNKFSVEQKTKLGALNARWGIAYGALNATKGIKKASEKVSDFLDEKSEEKSDLTEKDNSKKI